MSVEVRLVVDGEDVELNEFVTKMIGGVVEAMVSTLKGVDENWKVAKLEIVR